MHVSMSLRLFCSFSIHALLLYTSLLRTAIATSMTTTTFDEGESDRLALLAIKSQITYDPFQVTSSWNNSFHFCDWQGIACGHRDRRVTVLDLQSQSLQGSISSAIGNLTFLVRVSLQNNSLSGEIPHQVGRLFRLRGFDLSNNSFKGEIPDNLSHCSNLHTLLLGGNNLVGKIPFQFGSLSKLVLLNFEENKLTGGIPPSFGNLSLLQNLSLKFNTLGGSIPDSLGRMKFLKSLSLGPNMFSGMIPPSLYNISSIEKFSVSRNRLNGSLPPEIGLTLPNLRIFYNGGNRFSGHIPISLFNASGLQHIAIPGNRFTGPVPTNVGNLKSLQTFYIGDNHFGGGKADDLNFLTALGNCSSLQILYIDNNSFGGMLPNSIANLSDQLNILDLDRNQIYGSIPKGIENLSNLFLLNMGLNFLTGDIPIEIGRLQKLQEINLSGNRLSGKIPSYIGNLSQLYHLDLSNNILNGNIPSNLGNCQHLQKLDLSQNNLYGTIPGEVMVGISQSLTTLDLARNFLTGPLPFEVGNLKNLVALNISNNNISGQIPSTLDNCLSLERLNMEGNFFQGSIPPFFGSLRSLRYVDLSRNNLSGRIPNNLVNLSFLENLNLSYNSLEGEVPREGVLKNISIISVVGNKNLCGGTLELRLPACSMKESKRQGKSIPFKVMVTTISVILSLSLVISIFTLYWRRKLTKKPSSTISLQDGRYSRVSYDDLLKATNGFSSANLIGVGSFGFVYKGILPRDELPVAVKVLNLQEYGASKSFMAECEALRAIRHRNLLKILTSCSGVDFEGNDFKALVFELMHNGSLENWLHPTIDGQHLLNNLRFGQRLNIAIDVASALDYLHHHCQTPIVHCDLKPSNVLLDDDMTAHVGDFGLAKFLSNPTNNSRKFESSSVALRGSIGYVAPEYGVGGKVSTQGDVHSYGILLLEMFTGKRPTDGMFKDGLSIHNFSKIAFPDRVMEIVDPSLLSEEQDETMTNIKDQSSRRRRMEECLVSIVRIGVACSMESPIERMDIKDAIKELYVTKEVFLGFRIHRKDEAD